LSNSIASSKDVGCLGEDLALRALEVVEFIKRFQKNGLSLIPAKTLA
jgi:hypothetical protein